MALLPACGDGEQQNASSELSKEEDSMVANDTHAGGEGRNRLASEKSPYLLQHADNPVDWYPWGEEAFAEAARQDKPIFLSIGYSTCHWCHVMEHESFENAEVARLLNDAFVCVKVDREERPDIDNIYMAVCQMMTGRGGWPLTIIMTPDRRPFFAGTYIPGAAMLGFVPRVKQMWAAERAKLVDESERVTQALAQSTQTALGEALGQNELNAAYSQLASRFDAQHGGFGDRPKFPTPHNLLFLLRRWSHKRDAQSLEMVEKTLQGMRNGGMYDHVGFGFHRYSTDNRWFLPHFEKMLYDQAMLAMAYTEAWQATGKDAYRSTTDEIFTYVLRDMTDARGGFYSAEDADSDGEEGKFYLWSETELREVLGDADAAIVSAAWGVVPGGNYAEEASGEKSDRNILYRARSLDESAAALQLSRKELEEKLESFRQRLFDVRESRIHPGKDDKILADWNGLMIAALARAARAFDNPGYAERAAAAARFIMTEMSAPDGGLSHRYRAGSADITAMVDDYAFVVWGLLELYETTFEQKYLEAAIRYSEYAHRNFWDDASGGYFFTSINGEALLIRQKEVYDGAVPSGNSVFALNLIRIGRITADPKWEQRARDIGRAFQSQIARGPSAFTLMMSAVDFQIGPSFEVVIAANEPRDAQIMTRALGRAYLPRKVVVFRFDDNIARIAPYTREQKPLDGKPTAYVCRNYACELPTNDPEEMMRLLGSP